MTATEIIQFLLQVGKLLALFLAMIQIVPLLVWVERRGSAFIQNRFGPNRVGPFGLLQLLADAIKFAFKEEFVPDGKKKIIFYLAPIVALVPGALAFASLPLSIPIIASPFKLLNQVIELPPIAVQGYQLREGLVFVLGVSSLGTLALLMAGYASSNKFSMLGAVRASAQVISYELSLGLSLVGLVLIYGTFNFSEIVVQQQGTFEWLGYNTYIPKWGLFMQPLGFILFFVGVFAESNRAPFDLPEAESELVAGFHTEYGGMKMLLFYIGEYGHMLVGASIITLLFLGGYNIPLMTPEQLVELVHEQGFSPTFSNNAVSLLLLLIFLAKVLFLLWVFIWVRWTLPRFKFSQLMALGWKTLLPWALFNTVATAIVIFVLQID